MKQFRCIPIAIGLPVIFLAGVLFYLGFTWYIWIDSHDLGDVIIGISGVMFGLFMAAITGGPAIRRVEIHPSYLLCKGLFSKDTFEIEYEICNIGMDYHCQIHRKIWWIYLCYGAPPQYKLKNPANRMNSVKICPGFVKIMYSDEVYNALLEVLPKKQKTSLITARRCAGFEKQGRIVF